MHHKNDYCAWKLVNDDIHWFICHHPSHMWVVATTHISPHEQGRLESRHAHSVFIFKLSDRWWSKPPSLTNSSFSSGGGQQHTIARFNHKLLLPFSSLRPQIPSLLSLPCPTPSLSTAKNQTMATHLSISPAFAPHRRTFFAAKAVSPQNLAAPIEGEKKKKTVEKVKLGKSDVEVTQLGIGAWAWGDTTYWNDFQWDGKIYLVFFNFVCTGSFFFPILFFYWCSLDLIVWGKNVLDRKLKDAKGAFDSSIDSGITFFDTAEVYGAGVYLFVYECIYMFLRNRKK